MRSKAISLNDQGYQYYRQSRFNVAESKFSEALKINRLIDRRPGSPPISTIWGSSHRSRTSRTRR